MPFSSINALKSNAPRTTRSLVLSIASLLLPAIALHPSFGAGLSQSPTESSRPMLPPAGDQTQSGNPVSGPESDRRTAVVLRFAVESQPVRDAASLSAQACSGATDAPASADALARTDVAAPPRTVTVDPQILDAITDELQKRLAKKMSVMVNPNPHSIPPGALIISGCITRATKGNAAGRLIGMNVGASRLAVHVVILSKTARGTSPVDTFDIKVKGGNLLPPLGPVALGVHVAMGFRQTLSADAKKLAGQILKKYAKDMKAREV